MDSHQERGPADRLSRVRAGGNAAATCGPSASPWLWRLIGGLIGVILLASSGFGAESSLLLHLTGPAWQTVGTVAASAFLADGASPGAPCMQHSNAAPYRVETGQLVTNLSNGLYRLTTRAQNSGGQRACYLAGNDRLTSLPVSTQAWMQVVVRGIAVTNRQCRVRLVSDDPAGGRWCRLDELELARDDLPYAFLKGGDISELPRLEHFGARFRDGGVEQDCLQILKSRGFNLVRLRLYHDPGNPNHSPSRRLDPLSWQNPERTLAIARRAQAMGFQLQLTFHYSDYWSNPGTQHKPHAWEGLPFPDLKAALASFTQDFLTRMRDQGTPPEFVSLGNEIQGGILFPDGASTNFAQLAQLLTAGHDAVKSVCPSSQVVLHTSDPHARPVNWFFGQCASNAVPWDVIGLSFYPFWTGLTAEQVAAELDLVQATFRKPILIMETGYNWKSTTCDGRRGQLAHNGPEVFPSTPQGQKDFLLTCFNALKRVNRGACLGDIYWDPIVTCVPGVGWENGARNVVANTALFDFDGQALPALDAFEFNN